MFFGMPETAGQILLLAVLADDEAGELGACATVVADSYPALTPDCPEAHLFEREIAEQCAVVPAGHPWLKPVRRHPPDHAARAGRPPAVRSGALPVLSDVRRGGA